mmetsp:Transcript_67490/g.180325  ORF Transcript_67490/g.180325 Transcript_67490/m.180325 type:complete len:162 (+) Transcript_67490:193-678(+)
MDMLRRLIAQYSKDNSGVLNAEELARLVKSYSDTRQWTIEPANPTTEEMSWIERAAGKSIDENRLELALELWRSYITNRAGIERVFAKYDTDRSNLLEFHELKSYLADLSLGHPPAEWKVRAVMKEVNGADGVSRVQLMNAVSAWYDRASSPTGSACCVVC